MHSAAADTQAIAVTVLDVASAPGILQGSMWFTTAGPVTVAGGGTDVDARAESWSSATRGDRFDVNGGTTAGTISALPGFVAPAPVRGMHYVGIDAHDRHDRHTFTIRLPAISCWCSTRAASRP